MSRGQGLSPDFSVPRGPLRRLSGVSGEHAVLKARDEEAVGHRLLGDDDWPGGTYREVEGSSRDGS